jgi:hypothetical protein
MTEILLDLAFPTYRNPFSPLSVVLLFSNCAEAGSILKWKTRYEDAVHSVICNIGINRSKNG